MSRFAVLSAVAAAAASAGAAPVSYLPSDARYFTWLGRSLTTADGYVVTDLPAAAFSFRVTNASFIGLTIADSTTGGARLGVTFDTRGFNATHEVAGRAGDPNPSGRAMPGLQVATLLTSPLQSLYTLGSGGQIAGLSLTVTVQLLSEWEMMGSPTPYDVLAFTGVLTDGTLLPAPARPARRLSILGDSLSSGVGCGFDRPGGAACGDGVPVDDASRASGTQLCALLAAECEVVAASGITLYKDAGYNLQLVWPYTLGSMTYNGWAGAKVPWDFAAHPVDAVIVELGENDEHASPPPTPAALSAAYVAFVERIVTAYGGDKALPVFLTIAPHEAGQSAGMLLAVPALRAAGYSRVAFLNATAPNVVNGTSIDTGCAGHPSAAQALYSAQRAAPVVASVLGWAL